MIPQASGDHVIAPTPENTHTCLGSVPIRAFNSTVIIGVYLMLLGKGGGRPQTGTTHRSYERVQAAALPPSLSGTCDTRPARRWGGSG